MIQTGPARANELFAKLAETSEGAVKTREKLFAELKAEFELLISLEEQHLFPVLRKANEKDLVTDAIRENRELQARLDELEALPKNDSAFLDKVKDLQKAFRQHARDEKTEILPAVQRALSDEQAQNVAEKMEAGRAEAEQTRQDEAEERRLKARQERDQAERQEREQAERQEREQAERQAQQAEQRAEQARQARQAEVAQRERQESERRTREVARQTAEIAMRPAAAAIDTTRKVARLVGDVAEETGRTATRMPISPFAEMFLWPWTAAMPSRAAPTLRGPAPARPRSDDERRTDAGQQEQVIPLGEEVLDIGTHKVARGTARVRRYVVETPVERQVTLQSERVVVERRRPVGETPNGEILTEVTVEVTETTEVPVVGKRTRLREEIVVRTERTQHVETVRETLRRDEVEIEQTEPRRTPRLRTVDAER
jgi:uncharacterized protein (TIGR02271 family)